MCSFDGWKIYIEFFFLGCGEYAGGNIKILCTALVQHCVPATCKLILEPGGVDWSEGMGADLWSSCVVLIWFPTSVLLYMTWSSACFWRSFFRLNCFTQKLQWSQYRLFSSYTFMMGAAVEDDDLKWSPFCLTVASPRITGVLWIVVMWFSRCFSLPKLSVQVSQMCFFVCLLFMSEHPQFSLFA